MINRWVAMAALALSLVGPPPLGFPEATAQTKEKPRPVIADPSDWDVLILHPSGVKQKAVFRLRAGVLYPGISNVAVGRFAVDDEKRLHIEFNGHPKIPVGSAILEMQVPGRWGGIVTEPKGESSIEMVRRK